MALIAKDEFTQADLYLSIKSVQPNFRTRAISVNVEAYKSAAARTAYKSADAILLANNELLKAKIAEEKGVQDAYDALSLEQQKTGLSDFIAARSALNTAMDVIKAENAAQAVVMRENGPNEVYGRGFNIPPGAVPIAETGAVLLSDVYAWLMAGPFVGATQA